MSTSFVYHVFPFGAVVLAMAAVLVAAVAARRVLGIVLALCLTVAAPMCASVAWLLKHVRDVDAMGWQVVALLGAAILGLLGLGVYRRESRTCWLVWAVVAVYTEHTLGYLPLEPKVHHIFPLVVVGLLLMSASCLPKGPQAA